MVRRACHTLNSEPGALCGANQMPHKRGMPRGVGTVKRTAQVRAEGVNAGVRSVRERVSVR